MCLVSNHLLPSSEGTVLLFSQFGPHADFLGEAFYCLLFCVGEVGILVSNVQIVRRSRYLRRYPSSNSLRRSTGHLSSLMSANALTSWCVELRCLPCSFGSSSRGHHGPGPLFFLQSYHPFRGQRFRHTQELVCKPG